MEQFDWNSVGLTEIILVAILVQFIGLCLLCYCNCHTNRDLDHLNDRVYRLERDDATTVQYGVLT